MVRLFQNRLLVALLGSATALLVAGCVVGPDYERPNLPFDLNNFATTQDEEATDEKTEAETQAEAVNSSLSDVHSWWANLNDPLLTELLSRSCQENPGLLEAASRISQARSQREIVVGRLWPQLSGDLSYSRSRIAPFSSSQTGRRSGDTFDAFTNAYQATWEIDLFGQIERSIEAANARAHVAQEDYRDVLISLMSDIATNYVELRVLQHRHAIAKENIEVQTKNMELAETRNKAGLVGLLDVKQAETSVRTTEAMIPTLEEQIRLRLNRLSVLSGQPPSQQFYEYIGTGPVPTPLIGIRSGIPAQLVSQRPDIRGAEKELHAANADIGVAVADLYPRLSLIGNPSFDTAQFRNWFRSQSYGFSVGPTFQWNIFTMGRTLNAIEAQKAAREQAEMRFRNAVLLAVEEVDNGLISFRKSRQRAQTLEKAAAAAAESVGLSESTYQIGNGTFQRVVDAQRQLLQTQDQLATAHGDVVLAWINTYRALGGGWGNAPGTTTAGTVGGTHGGADFGFEGYSDPSIGSGLPGSGFGQPADEEEPDREAPADLAPDDQGTDDTEDDASDFNPVAGAPRPPSRNTGVPLPILESLHQPPRPSPWSTITPQAPLDLSGQQQPIQRSRTAWGSARNPLSVPQLPPDLKKLPGRSVSGQAPANSQPSPWSSLPRS